LFKEWRKKIRLLKINLFNLMLFFSGDFSNLRNLFILNFRLLNFRPLFSVFEISISLWRVDISCCSNSTEKKNRKKWEINEKGFDKNDVKTVIPQQTEKNKKVTFLNFLLRLNFRKSFYRNCFMKQNVQFFSNKILCLQFLVIWLFNRKSS
jgi:hypothetical protein